MHAERKFLVFFDTQTELRCLDLGWENWRGRMHGDGYLDLGDLLILCIREDFGRTGLELSV